MIPERVPEPGQIRDYLSSHGWTGETPTPTDVEIFTYREPSDDGEPITVYVPMRSNFLQYPLRVNDVVVTVAWVEDRPEEAVWSDLLGEKWSPKPRMPDPTPGQIRVYLSSHGWTGENPPPDDVEIFTHRERSDDGEPITVFVPMTSGFLQYPLRVRDVVVTAAGMEDRPEEAVQADMLAVTAEPRPGEPARPVQDAPAAEKSLDGWKP